MPLKKYLPLSFDWSPSQEYSKYDSNKPNHSRDSPSHTNEVPP